MLPFQKEVVSQSAENSYSQTAQLDQFRKSGGSIFVHPFTAGESVAASDVLDRISLSVISGLAESLQTDNNLFSLVSPGGSGKAAFIVKGRIIELTETQGLATWLGPQQKNIAVEGTLMNAKTGEKIFAFKKYENTRTGESFEKLGQRIGRKIGRIMISGRE